MKRSLTNRGFRATALSVFAALSLFSAGCANQVEDTDEGGGAVSDVAFGEYRTNVLEVLGRSALVTSPASSGSGSSIKLVDITTGQDKEIFGHAWATGSGPTFELVGKTRAGTELVRSMGSTSSASESCFEVDGDSQELISLGAADPFYRAVGCVLRDGVAVSWTDHSSSNVYESVGTLHFRTPRHELREIKKTRAGIFASNAAHIAYATASTLVIDNPEGTHPTTLAKDFRAYSMRFAGGKLLTLGQFPGDEHPTLYRLEPNGLRKITDENVWAFQASENGRAVLVQSPIGVVSLVRPDTSESIRFGFFEQSGGSVADRLKDHAFALPGVTSYALFDDGSIAFTTKVSGVDTLSMIGPSETKRTIYRESKGLIAAAKSTRPTFLLREEKLNTPTRLSLFDEKTRTATVVDDRKGTLDEYGISDDGTFVYAFRSTDKASPIQSPTVYQTSLGLFQVGSGEATVSELGPSARRSFRNVHGSLHVLLERRVGRTELVSVDTRTGELEAPAVDGTPAALFVSDDGVYFYRDQTGKVRARQL